MPRHIALLAEYNAWMNARLYASAEALPPAELMADKGAFFGSLYGTLSHIVLGDTIWLKRFASHPASHRALDPVRELPMPAGFDERSGDFAALRERRAMLDAVILAWAAELSQSDLDKVLTYNNLKGMPFSRRMDGLVLHFFNHQTHHRGQATTLLSQAGIDIGPTDLVLLVPEE
ncbi:MAG: DinB family protein [Telluria sp.]